MASLESLVYDRLAADSALVALLATVDGGDPAIFVEQAPDDTSRRWDTAAQTPRVVFEVQRLADPTRGNDATLLVGLHAPAAVLPAIAARVQARLDGTYWHPSSEAPLATRHRRTNSDPLLAELGGAEDAWSMEFDVLAFPLSPALVPDPVAVLNAWAAWRFVSADLVPAPLLQVDPSTWSSDDPRPALYFTVRGERLAEPTHGRWPTKLRWFAEVRGHVLTSDPTERALWGRRLVQALAERQAIGDGQSHVWIDRPLSYDATADPLRTGQVSAQAEFWTDIPRPTSVPLLRVQVVEEMPLEVPASAT